MHNLAGASDVVHRAAWRSTNQPLFIEPAARDRVIAVGASRDGEIVFLGVGDVEPILPPMSLYPERVKETFAAADIRLAQCERAYSRRGYPQVHANGLLSRRDPELAAVFAHGNFNLVSLASNHTMDWGGDALVDTKVLFEELGIQTIGGGANIEEARRPATFDVDGVKVGVLGYCSVLREGFAATASTPGIAPLRAHTYYRTRDYQPGTPPDIVTVPFAEDLRDFRADVAQLRSMVDVVVVSMHWGVHFVPRVIADYQRTIAREAFASGVDLIVGHHTHIPKGIEVIDGKVCFYSVGAFVPHSAKAVGDHPNDDFQPSDTLQLTASSETAAAGPARKRSLVARAVLTSSGVERVSFLPVAIEADLQPEILRRSDPRFVDAVNYMSWLSGSMPHTFALEGDEILIS